MFCFRVVCDQLFVARSRRFACAERLCQPCSLLAVLFTHLRFIACSFFMVLQLVLRLFWLREYLFFGSCSFARSEHRCQRFSLFILPFNLAPHRIICFHGFAACASMILATLGVFSACLVFREHLLPLCATLLCIMC